MLSITWITLITSMVRGVIIESDQLESFGYFGHFTPTLLNTVLTSYFYLSVLYFFFIVIIIIIV